MNNPILSEIVALTDALLAVARSPNPDLDQATLLLRERGNLISILPPATPEERTDRRAVLFELQAADAELRALLERRRERIRQELKIHSQRAPRLIQGLSRPRLLDHRV